MAKSERIPFYVRDEARWIAGQRIEPSRRWLFVGAENMTHGIAGDHAGGDAGIVGRGVEFGVTQERLDDTDIGAAFEQMRCKAMTQHMQCDVLPDPGGVGCLMEEARELPRGHRLAGSLTRLPARKQPTFLKGCSRIVTRGRGGHCDPCGPCLARCE